MLVLSPRTVVPVLHADGTLCQVVAIIDIDCAVENGFDAEDQQALEQLAVVLSDACEW